jgi:hypothetical protein
MTRIRVGIGRRTASAAARFPSRSRLRACGGPFLPRRAVSEVSWPGSRRPFRFPVFAPLLPGSQLRSGVGDEWPRRRFPIGHEDPEEVAWSRKRTVLTVSSNTGWQARCLYGQRQLQQHQEQQQHQASAAVAVGSFVSMVV